MNGLDLTTTDGRHYRFNSPEVRILGKAGHSATRDGQDVKYDGTWIVEIRTQPDENDVHATEWADGHQPSNFRA